MSHPKHPATVHFPITTTFLTGALDAAYFLSIYAPTSTAVASAVKTLDIAIQPSAFPVLSYYTTILTIFFSLPAIATGAYELMPVIQRDGFSSKKAKVGVLHAVVNDVTVFGALYNWWSRRNTPQFTPSPENVLVSTVLAVPASLFAAYLGGQLVYHFGMGFRGSSAKAKKKQ